MLKQQNELEMEYYDLFEKDKYNIPGLFAKSEKVANNQHHIVIILNFPHNPTGYCPTKEEMEEIVISILDFIWSSKTRAEEYFFCVSLENP